MIYPPSLHDALPISSVTEPLATAAVMLGASSLPLMVMLTVCRSEEQRSALHSPRELVCRLWLGDRNCRSALLTVKFQVTWPAPSPLETLVMVCVKVPR